MHRDIVAGLVVSKDHKVLFGMKDPEGGGVYADYWHTPGGGIDKGETHEQALRRELLEEVGINVHDARVVLLDDTGRGESKKTLRDTGEVVRCKMQFFVYRIDIDKNAADIAVIPGGDIEKIVWADIDKLHEYQLTPPSVELFTRLGWLH